MSLNACNLSFNPVPFAPRATRLRSVCVPFAFRLRSVCVPFAFRLRSACVPSAFRLRSVCVPPAFRLRSVCVCVYYELALILVQGIHVLVLYYCIDIITTRPAKFPICLSSTINFSICKRNVFQTVPDRFDNFLSFNNDFCA